jgi:hypothetical protein
VTTCDLDGFVCGILLKEIGLIDRIAFAHPKDIESRRMEIAVDDITAGLPFHERAHMAFSSHPGGSTTAGRRNNAPFDRQIPSASRAIYTYFGRAHFPRIPLDMLETVDKAVGGNIGIDDILHPTGWMLLEHLIDRRTGLEPLQQSSISTPEFTLKSANYCMTTETCVDCPRSLPQLITTLVDHCHDQTIWEILNLRDVEERLRLYFQYRDRYKDQLFRCASVHSNLVVIDMRNERTIHPGYRLMVDALFPECNVSLQVFTDSDSDKAVFVARKSCVDRSFVKDIGHLMGQCNGEGHADAGMCRVGSHQADEVLATLIGELEYSPFKNLFLGYFNYHQYR